ncbi:fungal-specific transcription factor domain-containing protein [Exophiala viscosa]|uniref:Fungal-specific transcription factor domain-containing protein n=1 Tax=Exophiala viscosa TaxID=2486360 RepID=A0AAN6E6J7_9EURO|nr:fungal-specific transcription factor domain-containing protein [Exophiala viscosa]
MEDIAAGAKASRKRHFKIHSNFGSARQWRSRKNRPCDVCRRRRTACVIEDRPPCLFCKGRSLHCEATTRSSRGRDSPDQEMDHDEDHLDDSVTPANPSPPEGGIPVTSIASSDIPLEQAVRSPTTGLPAPDIPNGPGSSYLRPRIDKEVRLPEPEVHTLEDGKNMTAHSMGLSAEQDTHLLDSFRSVIIDETNTVDGDMIQVDSGDPRAGVPPIHFCILRDWFMPYDNRIKEESSRMIEMKVGSYGPDLVRLYFKHVHPVYCVVSKVRFLRAYRDDKLGIPASLRGVLYGLGAVYWKDDLMLKSIPCPFENYELFIAAQNSLERELEAPNLWKMQACLLMLHEKAAGNATFETPRIWTLSAQAVACAQMIGLHRDPSNWKIAPWEKSLRKKLWWATYVTDMWSSVSHGNPPHIYRASYTTPELNMDDLKIDEHVPEGLRDTVDDTSADFDASTAARFLELVKLTQIVHTLLDTAFTDQSYRNAMMDMGAQESKLLNIQRDLESWYSMIPQCVTMSYTTNKYSFRNNAPLHLAYFATQVLLFRALMTPASVAAKHNPQSSLRRFFDAAIEKLGLILAFMDQITVDILREFWGQHGRSQLILIGNFLIHLFLVSSNPEQVHLTFRLLGRFHESLQRIGELVDEDSVQLIRPVALRIDSFFTQAAQIMRRGSATGSYSMSLTGDTPV